MHIQITINVLKMVLEYLLNYTRLIKIIDMMPDYSFNSYSTI